MAAAGGIRAAVGLSLVTALVVLYARGGVLPPGGGRTVTLEAAALIGLCYYLSQSAWLAGLAYWTLYRPLVGGVLVGVVLGDPWAGAAAGATINLAFLGFLGTGAALPTDMALIGYAGATIALATGLGAAASLALAMPLGLVGYGLYRLRLRWSNWPARRAVRRARRGDPDGMARWHVLAPQAMLVLLAWAPGSAAAYLGPLGARWMLGMAPEWALLGLGVTGALLAALGVAGGLALVWTRRTVACFLGASVIGIVTVGAAMALAVGLLGVVGAMVAPWLSRSREAGSEDRPAGPAQGLADVTGGATVDGPVRPRDRMASLLAWLFFSHAGYSEERMQGVGLAQAMAPVLRRLYTSPATLAGALGRYIAPFNVEPNLGSAIVGALAYHEEVLARGNVAYGAPDLVRARLVGPVSGVGDAVIHGALGTVIMALGVVAASVLGHAAAVGYSAVMAAVVWGGSSWAFHRGYREGFAGVLALLRGGAWRRVVVGAECAGAIVLGLLVTGPVTALFAPHIATGSVVAPFSLADRATSALPVLALVLVLLALQRWWVHHRWLTIACYVIGSLVALLRF